MMTHISGGESSVLPGITPEEEGRFGRYLMEREGISPNEMRDALVALGLWLWMCSKPHQGRFVPSRAIDQLWHALILHTRLYTKVCKELGAVIHHTPTLSKEKDGGKGYRRTLAHMRQQAIPFNTFYWPQAECTDDCDGCGDDCSECGACTDCGE